jgi:hypothetical protein
MGRRWGGDEKEMGRIWRGNVKMEGKERKRRGKERKGGEWKDRGGVEKERGKRGRRAEGRACTGPNAARRERLISNATLFLLS